MKSEKPVIGIIGGRGKMGTFFRHLFEEDGYQVLIAGRTTKLTYPKLCELANIVFISVPAGEASELIQQIIPYLKPDTLLVDFSSFQMKNRQSLDMFKGASVGIHPLFGPLVKSIEGQVFSFTPHRKNKLAEFLENYFEKKGARVITLEAADHDRQMALVQSVIHFANITLGATLKDAGTRISKDLSTPLFRLQQLVTGRVFGQDPELYENILMENPESDKTLSEYTNQTLKLLEIIKSKDRPEFEHLYMETKNFLGSFVEVAGTKTTEILALIDRQPVRLDPGSKQTDITNATVSYLGPEGTYSYQVTRQIFPHCRKLTGVNTITAVFDSVADGESDFGIVPAENLIEGAVKETISSMVDYPVKILAEIPFPIRHCLASKSNSIREILTVRSHPQAIGQCRNYLKTHLPNAKIEPVASTVSGAKGMDRSTAIIASKEAAQLNGLNVLAENIGDNPDNVTTFYVISNHLSRLFDQKSSKAILLLNVYDRVGVLRDILDVFASNSLNLSRLISIPTGIQSGEYDFLIDVDIKERQQAFQNSLDNLKQYCKQIRILGEV